MSSLLPLFKVNDETLTLWQTRWKSLLDSVLGNRVVNGLQLSNISLAVGNNTIPHKLGRQMQGWFIVDQNAASEVYRSQPFGQTTLTLNASVACIVSLWVF